MNEDEKQLVYLIISLVLVFSVFGCGFYNVFFNKTIYTIEVYEIFEVTHTENSRGEWTNVYTYGQGQFYFRGYHQINVSSSYSFTYTENQKRWRDLTLIEFREFTPLRRDSN